jgi:hypothetical protein
VGIDDRRRLLDYGLIVDGENSREVVEATIDRLRNSRAPRPNPFESSSPR